MAEQDASCLSHVSGLYGPGTMLGWYLTLLGCFTSWTLHPHQKSKDSLNADMISALLFPLAACSHLISLSRNAHHHVSDTDLLSTCQASKAIEAPARVVFIWHSIAIMIYCLPALHHLKRGFALATTLAICYWTQVYVYDAALIDVPQLLRPINFFSRNPAISTVLTTMVGFDFVSFATYVFAMRKQGNRIRALEAQSGTEGAVDGATREEEPEPLHSKLIHTRVGMVVWCFVVSVTGLQKWWFAPKIELSRDTWKILFPDTEARLRDVDQIVAATGGALALLVNLVGVGRYWYGERQKSALRKEAKETGEREAMKMERRWHGQAVEERSEERLS